MSLLIADPHLIGSDPSRRKLKGRFVGRRARREAEIDAIRVPRTGPAHLANHFGLQAVHRDLQGELTSSNGRAPANSRVPIGPGRVGPSPLATITSSSPGRAGLAALTGFEKSNAGHFLRQAVFEGTKPAFIFGHLIPEDEVPDLFDVGWLPGFRRRLRRIRLGGFRSLVANVF
jgi:hypothetical protein